MFIDMLHRESIEKGSHRAALLHPFFCQKLVNKLAFAVHTSVSGAAVGHLEEPPKTGCMGGAVECMGYGITATSIKCIAKVSANDNSIITTQLHLQLNSMMSNINAILHTTSNLYGGEETREVFGDGLHVNGGSYLVKQFRHLERADIVWAFVSGNSSSAEEHVDGGRFEVGVDNVLNEGSETIEGVKVVAGSDEVMCCEVVWARGRTIIILFK